jgi:hypothetical protein
MPDDDQQAALAVAALVDTAAPCDQGDGGHASDSMDAIAGGTGPGLHR